jgi:hypothetical protein
MKLILAFFLITIANNVYAETNICHISGMFMFTKISWNSDTGEARLTDMVNRQSKGTYVYSREHNGDKAHSIRFVFDEEVAAGTDMAEFLILPKDKEGKRKILGVAFRLDNNDKYVDFSYGTHEIQCLSN